MNKLRTSSLTLSPLGSLNMTVWRQQGRLHFIGIFNERNPWYPNVLPPPHPPLTLVFFILTNLNSWRVLWKTSIHDAEFYFKVSFEFLIRSCQFNLRQRWMFIQIENDLRKIFFISLWIFAAAVSDPKAKERGSSLIGKWTCTFFIARDCNRRRKELWLCANARIKMRGVPLWSFSCAVGDSARWVQTSSLQVKKKKKILNGSSFQRYKLSATLILEYLS